MDCWSEMKTKLKRCLAPLIAAAVLSVGAFAQTTSAIGPPEAKAKRPKICLVLSGGGARGAAHIGVLKVLQELRVPVHCITGTSVGALIGGSYAMGTSIEGLEHIMSQISTELLYKERPPRQEQSMRRKADDYNIFVGPEIGVGRARLDFAKGVVTGVQLETVLRQLARTQGHHDFDRLPIPFRAVATDLVNGKPVVFREGDLAQVMRASMSVPGAVAPAEFGGMMLVDGMLARNLPVEDARAMGADIIIAVNVGTPLLTREQLSDIFGVAGQMLSILTEQNVQRSLATLQPSDILISPELGDYSTADFDHLEKIAPLGDPAARRVAARLRDLALPEAEYLALRERQQQQVIVDYRPVDEIRFNGLKRVNPRSAQMVMETEAGRPIDRKELDRDMRRIYGTGDFEHVNYRFIEEPGRRVLAVEAVEKSWGPDYLRFGLGLSTDFSGDAYFNLLGSYRRTWLNSLGGEWRTDMQIGRTSSFQTEFYQPLTAESLLFVAPRFTAERRNTNVYDGNTRVARYRINSEQVGLDVGSQFYRYGELRVGALRGTLRPALDTGPAALSPGNSSIAQGAYVARLTLDQLDNVSFPRSGWRAGANIFDSNKALGADEAYTKWDADGTAAYTVDNHSFNLAFKAGGRRGAAPIPRYDQFQWGGFMQQSGYATGQLLGERVMFGRAVYFHRILRGSVLEGAYGGFSLEVGKVGVPLVQTNSDALLKSGSIFVAADTPLGPAYLAYGRSGGGLSAYYFYLGKPF